MKKYVFIFIAMFLCSCKPSNSFESHTDAVSVQRQSVKDSLRSDFLLQFDRFDMWFEDSVVHDSGTNVKYPTIKKHICIIGGSLSNSNTELKMRHVEDSTHYKTQQVMEPVFRPPQVNRWFVILTVVIICFIIIGSRKI